jgi:hypothetical protein
MAAALAMIRTVPLSGGALLVCLAACAGGLLARVVEDLSGAAPTLLLGLSPLELLIIFVAARALAQAGAGERIGAPHALAALGLLVPSGAAAWIALGAFALWRSLWENAQARFALLLFAALALSELWMSVGFKTVASLLLPLDAQMTAYVLGLVGFAPQVTGNVVQVPGGNTIVVLVTCATLHRMPLAILAAIALAAPASRRQLVQVGVLVVIGYGALNLARLVGMGVSAEWYAFLHQGTGASLYDAAQTALVFLAARRAQR